MSASSSAPMNVNTSTSTTIRSSAVCGAFSYSLAANRYEFSYTPVSLGWTAEGVP